MQIGELTDSPHTLKAKDVLIGDNKNKFLLILHTSKTHGLDSKPQLIKISQLDNGIRRCFCPFAAMNSYMGIRGPYINDNEHFFVFSDRSPIKPEVVHNLLKRLLKRAESKSGPI